MKRANCSTDQGTLMSRIAELESSATITTGTGFRGLNGDRKCHRLVGGVLGSAQLRLGPQKRTQSLALMVS